MISSPPGKYGRKAEIEEKDFLISPVLRTVDLKELAGEHYKGCGVRFNLTQRRESHQRRRQDEGQSEGLTQRAER